MPPCWPVKEDLQPSLKMPVKRVDFRARQRNCAPCRLRPPTAQSFTMDVSSPPVDALEPDGWSHNEGGEIIERRPQSNGYYAFFKHTRPLQAKDVWRMRVEVGGFAFVGFASDQ